jgi:hypothetical protein
VPSAPRRRSFGSDGTGFQVLVDLSNTEIPTFTPSFLCLPYSKPAESKAEGNTDSSMLVV